jgi:hypothetical protein
MTKLKWIVSPPSCISSAATSNERALLAPCLRPTCVATHLRCAPPAFRRGSTAHEQFDNDSLMFTSFGDLSTDE